MSKSLYEQNPAAWEKLRKEGKPHLADIAKHFNKCADLNRAIDVAGASHWLAGRNSANMKSDLAAKRWLEGQLTSKSPEPQAKPVVNLFLVSCPDGKADKVRKVLEMMGCEVVEV